MNVRTTPSPNRPDPEAQKRAKIDATLAQISIAQLRAIQALADVASSRNATPEERIRAAAMLLQQIPPSKTGGVKQCAERATYF